MSGQWERPCVALTDFGAIGAPAFADMLRRMAEDAAKSPLESDVLERIAAQIEAQIKPPKPPEPTGLGAVVVDAAGDKWVHFATDAGMCVWYRDGDPAVVNRATYNHIDAVRVLSEGVQP